MKQSTALKLVLDELERATDEHGPFASAHEAASVIREEYEELWDEVKAGNSASDRAASEAVQLTAMGLRYLIDLCPESAAVEHEEKVERYRVETRSFGGYSG
jgi:hypothetical protein